MNDLWTYMLTRLLSYACDFVRLILYITLHTTNLNASCQMHFITRSEVHSRLHSIAHSQLAWLYAPNCSRWHTPSLLDLRSQVSSQDTPKYTPGKALNHAPNCTGWHSPACLTIRSRDHSQDALKHTPEITLKDASNCTRWHTPSLLDCTLPSKLSRRSQTHSQACSQGCSQVHSMTLPAWLTVRSQVSSQDALKHTPKNALKHAPNCARWHTPSLLDCTLPS